MRSCGKTSLEGHPIWCGLMLVSNNWFQFCFQSFSVVIADTMSRFVHSVDYLPTSSYAHDPSSMQRCLDGCILPRDVMYITTLHTDCICRAMPSFGSSVPLNKTVKKSASCCGLYPLLADNASAVRGSGRPVLVFFTSSRRFGDNLLLPSDYVNHNMLVEFLLLFPSARYEW